MYMYMYVCVCVCVYERYTVYQGMQDGIMDNCVEYVIAERSWVFMGEIYLTSLFPL